jgi:hypothetical protein
MYGNGQLISGWFGEIDLGGQPGVPRKKNGSMGTGAGCGMEPTPKVFQT